MQVRAGPAPGQLIEDLVPALIGTVHALKVGHQHRDRDDQADDERHRRNQGQVLKRALFGLDRVGPFAPARQCARRPK